MVKPHIRLHVDYTGFWWAVVSVRGKSARTLGWYRYASDVLAHLSAFVAEHGNFA